MGAGTIQLTELSPAPTLVGVMCTPTKVCRKHQEAHLPLLTTPKMESSISWLVAEPRDRYGEGQQLCTTEVAQNFRGPRTWYVGLGPSMIESRVAIPVSVWTIRPNGFIPSFRMSAHDVGFSRSRETFISRSCRLRASSC